MISRVGSAKMSFPGELLSAPALKWATFSYRAEANLSPRVSDGFAPSFEMRLAIPIVVLRGDPGEELTLMLHTAAPKYKDNPYSEPTASTTGMRTGDIA
jgi:hypothetical protein